MGILTINTDPYKLWGDSYQPEHDYSKDYLTFEVLEDGTFTVSINPSAISNYRKLYYSIDEGETWIDIISNLNEPEDDWYYYTSPTITSETNILWKGDIDSLSYNYDKALKIISTFTFNASGNPFFLFRGVDWESASTDYEISALFSENNKIISAENLYLSFDNTIGGKVFTCRNHYGLNLLFYGCSNLEVAPKTLPNELFESCFSFMFEYCSKLTSVPLDYLPVTTLAPYCYEEMFSGCTNLVQAPELPATTLTQSCYSQMFNQCSKLNRIKMMATDISATSCLNYWVSGVATTGTFVKNKDAEWTKTGASGVPTGWTVETV